MKKVVFAFLLIMTFASHAFAFNPDPVKYEYIGQKKSDGNAVFYEIATAKADGQKGVVVMLQADPKNRVLRYYRNVVIDPESMTMRGSYCEVREGTVNISGGFIQDNKTTGPGGGIYNTGTVSMSGGTEVIVDLEPADTIVDI